MKKLVAVISAVLLFLLTGCGEVAGPVVDKDFKPAHIVIDQVPQYTTICVPVTRTTTSNGRTSTYTSTSCTQHFTHYLPVPRHVPDKWLLRVHDEESDKNKWVRVTHKMYDSKDVGDFFSNKKDAEEDGNF